MKKALIITAVLLSSYVLQAQISPHAMGIRVGGGSGVSGFEFSYQHAMRQTNRLELDLGLGGNDAYSRVTLAGIYHWHWNLNKGLNWYAGPGAALGFYSIKDHDNYTSFAIGGQVGLEYNFNDNNAPILLSLDTRPMWDLAGDYSGFFWGIALGVRYTW